MKYQAAIFDMDGTVLDTSGDLTDALIHAFEETGHQVTFSVREAVNFYGSGMRNAVNRALLFERGHGIPELETVGTSSDHLTETIDPAETDQVLGIFNPYYAAHCALQTGPYPGIIELLKRLRTAAVRCAVVSNKPDMAVQQLVTDYYDGLFDFALGERTDLQRKPHPDMTLYALRQLGVCPEQAVYIGDSEIDMQTADNAGLDCISVDYGFRSRAFLKAHGAACIVSSAAAVGDLILGNNE